MVRDLVCKRMLITGASSGIGRCLAEDAAKRGALLALVARSADKLEELARSLTARGATAIAVPGDITSAEDRQRVLRTVVSCFGGLDVLINNAGVAGWGHFASSSEQLLRQIMEVNFFAPAELIRLAIPHLARGREPAIVNVASMCGRRGLPAWSEYSASKFALVGLSESLRAELARLAIDVIVILPGLTRSDLGRHLLKNTGRLEIRFDQGMPPEDAARGIVRALLQGRAETVLGSDAKWMLRLNRWVPRLLDRLIARKVRQLYAN